MHARACIIHTYTYMMYIHNERAHGGFVTGRKITHCTEYFVLSNDFQSSTGLAVMAMVVAGRCALNKQNAEHVLSSGRGLFALN